MPKAAAAAKARGLGGPPPPAARGVWGNSEEERGRCRDVSAGGGITHGRGSLGSDNKKDGGVPGMLWIAPTRQTPSEREKTTPGGLWVSVGGYFLAWLALWSPWPPQ